MTRLLGASVLAPSLFFAAADIGASLVAAHNLLLGCSSQFHWLFGHLVVPSVWVRAIRGSDPSLPQTTPGDEGEPKKHDLVWKLDRLSVRFDRLTINSVYCEE